MAGFLDPLRVELRGWEAGRPVWALTAPLRYRSDRLGTTIVVPSGFVTDLASVPRVALLWLVAGGRAPRPSVPHDYAYQAHTVRMEDGTGRPVTRAEADAVFYEALRADPLDGAGPVLAWCLWAAVRVGGGPVWARAETRTAWGTAWKGD